MTTFKAQIKDSYGNLMTNNSTTTLTLSLSSGTGTLGGTLNSLRAPSGVATFDDVIYSKAEAITLKATENTSGSSNFVTGGVTVSPSTISATTSVVTVASATVASASSVALTLTAKDTFGNSLSTGGSTIVFSNTSGTSTGSLEQ